MNPEAALKRVVAQCKKAFIAVGLFSLAINLLMLTVPIYMMQMYDRVISSGNVDTLLLLTLIAIAGIGCMSLVEMMRGRIMVRLGAWVDRALSGPVLSGGMNDSLRAGGLTGANGLRELNTLRGFLTGAGVFPLLDAPWVPIFVAIIFVIHPILGFLAVGGAVVVFLFALANDISTRKPLKQANGAASKALYRADAMVRNADVAAAMGMEPQLVRRWRDSNEEGLTLQALASDRAGGISSSAKFVRLALQIGMLGVGAYLVTQGQLTGGGMIAGSIILSRAMAPIEQSINAWRGLIAAKGAYESIKTLLSRTPATGDAMSLPRPSGKISLEGIGFVPPGAPEPVLRGVTLEIAAGECIGLIGASASGKTTLARILVGSWRPTAGHARLDGADVFMWDAADRGRYIGYLPQDVELFDGPIRENIARMGEPDTDAVIAAAELANVHELILRLPNGYETMIGEGGARLSGGQRQRIALARALYDNPALVVLDEPNSNLDTEGERALMEVMAELKERKVTTIVVAHRPSVLASVDRLVVMHQGRIEMEGPRDEILAKIAPGSVEAVRQAAIQRPDPALAATAARDAGADADADGPVIEAAAPPKPPGPPPIMRIRPGSASADKPAAAAEKPAATVDVAGEDAPPAAAPAPKPPSQSPLRPPVNAPAAQPASPAVRRTAEAPTADARPQATNGRARPLTPATADKADTDVKDLLGRIGVEAPEPPNDPAPRRRRKALHPSPTEPGALAHPAGGAMTGDAKAARIPPRSKRKEA